MFGKVKHHFARGMALGRGVVHRANALYKRGVQFASDLDKAVSIGRHGIGIIAPKLGNFMGDYLAQGTLSGVMHGIGAYDEFMATHDTVMDKIRQGGPEEPSARGASVLTQRAAFLRTHSPLSEPGHVT